MRSCFECKFITDYGLFRYCEVKDEIIRHEKRYALTCKYFRRNNTSKALEEFADAINEFLDNFPGEENRDEED